MSHQLTVIKEIRVPLTHHQGELRAEWLIKVYKVSNGYACLAEENDFESFDDMIIEKILRPIKSNLDAEFQEMMKLGTLKNSAMLDGGAGAYLMIIGFNRENSAVGFACRLAETVERVLANLPSYQLDRENMIKNRSDKPEVFYWIEAYNERAGFVEHE